MSCWISSALRSPATGTPLDQGLSWPVPASLSVRVPPGRLGSVAAMTRLSPGDKAPDFSLLDADGSAVSLKGLRGKKVVVYFYPAAMTPGCTKQACDFRD